MSFRGDGLSYKAVIQNSPLTKTMEVKTSSIKLPSMLNIAASYDIRLDQAKGVYDNRLTLGFAFTNHSFSANQTTLSAEYAYKEMLSVRGGFCYQNGLFGDEVGYTTAYSGPMAGVSYDFKINDENVVSLDYSYRASRFFNGTHSFGIRIGLGSAE